MTLLILYICIAIAVSFFCSVLEAVLLSTSQAYVANLESQGHPAGARLRALKENLDPSLAAILSLNTIAHTVGATGAGAQAAAVFGDAYVGLFSGVLTLAILVLSEIVPKTLGAQHWRRLAPLLPTPLRGTIVFMAPFVGLSKLVTRLLSRKSADERVDREEFQALADLGTRQGVFHENESRVLENLLRLRTLDVQSIMTPRTVMFSVPATSTVAEFLVAHPSLPFSRIPLHRETKDQIVGFVLKSRIQATALDGKMDTTLGALAQAILPVPETASIMAAFDQLLQNRAHIALVVDEYGGTAGIVTQEDIIETLLGLEIMDESDTVEDLQGFARERWERRRRVQIESGETGD